VTYPGFHAMRADLIERGLIAADGHTLTAEGQRYVDALLFTSRGAASSKAVPRIEEQVP